MRWSSFFKCWVLSQHFHSPSHIKRLFSSCSFQFSCSITFNSLWPYGLQHTRLPCPSPTQSFLKFMSMELVMPSNHLILCLPLILLSSIFPSIRVFSSESPLLIRWPKYWSFSFHISPWNEYLELISFRIDWFDLFTVQGTLKCLLQHQNSETTILWCSAFFMVQLSHSCMTTGKITLSQNGFICGP